MKLMCVLTLLSLLAFRGNSQGEWKLAKDSDGIEVYTRNRDDSNLKEFYAVTAIDATMDDLVAVIDDVESYPEWQSNVQSTTLLDQEVSHQWHMYITTDVPWPAKDRDLVLFTQRVENDSGAVHYNFACKPGHYDEQNKMIRVEVAAGSWRLTPLDNGAIEVYHTFYMDPGGTIPDWVVNMFIVDGPYKTLKNLRDLVEGQPGK